MSKNYSFNAILQPAVANTIQPLSANNLLSGQSGEISDIIGIIGQGGSAAISGNNVVWTGFEANGYERAIYFWDGSTTTQLTNYFTYDNNPQISGNNVVWFDFDGGNGYEIYFWNGSTTTQVTNNSTFDYAPQISGNNVVWTGYDGYDYEIYFWDGSTVTQVTDHSIYESYFQISGNNMVWQGYDGNGSEIYFWDGSTVTQVTNNSIGVYNPQISGNNVVWQGYDGNDSEIYFWDGSTITQVTNNFTDDGYPQISGNNVVWAGYDGNDYEIYFWDGSTTTQVTNNSTYDLSPQISGNNVVWTGDGGNYPEIYFWDGSIVTQVTNNSIGDYNPQISGNNITWAGFAYQDYAYGNVYFDTIAKENFTTTAQLDTINARGGDDTVTSTFANLQQGDFIKGGIGTDTLIITTGTSAKNVAIDLNNSASQVLNPSGTTISGFERFDLSSFLGTTSFLGTADNDWIKSGAGNDDLGGGDGNDYLNGGEGADLLGGGKGDDTYVVDNAGDVTAEFLNSGTDTVESSLTWTLKANLENLTLIGSANLNGTGNSLNNALTGNTGNNILDGGAGTDRLVGGLGNDTYLVDSNRDVVVEKAGEGKDTVQSTATHSLTDNVENLALLGTANINGTGNALGNLITGNSGNNLLKGLDGYDTLIGGAGNDTFIGGAGNDTLTGGAGNDQFLFGSGAKFTPTHFGVDTVTDFVKGTDKISLSKVSFTALTSAIGNLNSSEFALINSAVNELFLAGSSSAKIVYNSATGKLFYNQNSAIAGLGTGGSFATLSGLPSLGATDFLVQAQTCIFVLLTVFLS